jgi:tetratricopeptide (TPR) repeat protein
VQPNPQLAEALAAFQRGDLARARGLAEAELATRPDSPQLQHLLGLVHCRGGDIGEGVEWLRRAAEAQPENLHFQVMLVRALVDGGRPGEALAAAPLPRGTGPAELALWHARAEAADACAHRAAAAEAWQVVANARPVDWRAWSNLGNAFAATERWDEAAEALGRAARLNGSEAAIRRNLASAHARCNRHPEALEQFERALELDPGHIETRLTYARLLAEEGLNQESISQLDEAARLATGGAQASGQALDDLALSSPEAMLEVALLLERTSRMDALRELIDKADKAGLEAELGYVRAALALREGRAAEARELLLTEPPDRDSVRWHRLMAKIADALGEPATAFAEAERMNRAVHEFDDWRARGAEYRERIRGLARIVTPKWAASLPRLEPLGRRSPGFLVGFPRSGTTLLDTFLMGHPDTIVLEEVHLLGAAERVIGKLPELPKLPLQKLADARAAYLEELDRHVELGFAGLVIDKLPLNMLGLPLIRSLFPDANIIFAQRHPCDAVLSSFMQSFVMNDAMACFLTVEDAADLYDAAMDVYTRGRDALGVPVHTLVYERLIDDPQAELRPLIEFLDLDWRDDLLDHRATAKSRGAIITPSYDQVVQPLSRAPVGRWRRYQKQLEPVLPVLLPWAERLGYTD